jgi:ribosomal protein S18 acetylase RimI-like enzyme
VQRKERWAGLAQPQGDPAIRGNAAAASNILGIREIVKLEGKCGEMNREGSVASSRACITISPRGPSICPIVPGLEANNGGFEELFQVVELGAVKIELREDPNPDADFYYRNQFRIYHEPYLIWDRETWAEAIAASTVYRIEVDGVYAGNVFLEDEGRGTKYISDISVLPEFQARGIGKAALEKIKSMARRVTAVTRKETLGFFLRSGFALRRRLRDYYETGVDGYDLAFPGKRLDERERR